MKAEILCVGSELLLGQIIDTNAAWMAQQLSRIGVDLHRKQTAGDNLGRIVDCIRGALARTDALIITGGLGPTTDDLTREAIAQALGVPLEFHPELEAPILELWTKRGKTPPDTIGRQAQLPQGARALENTCGTAPGVFATASGGQMIFAVPGVPKEMKAMLELSIIPELTRRMDGAPSVIVSRVLRTVGIGESSLEDPIADILLGATNPTAAPLIFGNTEVHVRLTAKAGNVDEANTMLDELDAQIRERVGEHIFGIDDETLPAVVLRRLRERGETLAVAESVTGGVLSQMLTDVAGASDVFRGAVVSYTNDAKTDVLGVEARTLQQFGAVHAETATAMAQHAREQFKSTWALSTTGEAGPTSQSGASVGTVFVGLAGDEARATQLDLFGDRDSIRRRSAMNALNILRLKIS
ncbi:MAG TPA: competence/damage-inducible protein A [Abditibacteriaceae bacterium]